MDELYTVIVSAFTDIMPNDIISGEVNPRNLSLNFLGKIRFTYEENLEEAEIEKKLRYLKDQVEFQLHEEKEDEQWQSGLNIYDLIKCFIKDILVKDKEEVVCRFEHLQSWRAVTNMVDSNIFVAAKYAEIDYKNGKTRNTFTWTNIIGHNNVRLNTILSKGISENHFHLHGSVYYFDLSWLGLMNQVNSPEFIQKLDVIDNDRRNPRVQYGYSHREQKYFLMHLQAALIRLYLFTELTGQKIKLGGYYVSWNWFFKHLFKYENINEIFSFNKENVYSEDLENEETKQRMRVYCPGFYWLLFDKFQRMGKCAPSISEICKHWNNLSCFLENWFQSLGGVDIEEIRHIFYEYDPDCYEREWKRQTLKILLEGLRKPENLLANRDNIQRLINGFLDFGSLNRKDYAANVAGNWYERDNSIAVMAGERWILYTMFRRMYGKPELVNTELYTLFYAYLVIKESFRRELLQNNDKLGFLNFRAYQKRKAWFTTQYTDSELAQIAVGAVFRSQPVKKLEIRIKPANTCAELADMIERYDREIRKEIDKDNNIFFYVLHFTKESDNFLELGMSPYNSLIYRHYQLREKIRRQAEAIIKLRKKNPQIAMRIRGIDACSNEDVCRPEVFASAYRVLRNHSCYQGLSLKPEVPQLRATYHVGEVFQDIVDGLRAIDEAIHFLNMDCGDRLGHATVLGIDVDSWYRDNGYKITIRQQDYLDNVVWLHHRLAHHHVSDIDGLLGYLESEFQFYYSLIYGKAIEEKYVGKITRAACAYDEEYGKVKNNDSILCDFNINTYYYSWMLRGDDPGLYADGYYKRNYQVTNLWEEYSVNQSFPKKKRVRYILPAVILYHYYHYNLTVKRLGQKAIEVSIPANMIKGIQIAQQDLQWEIAEKEIAIETNPSSNVMISRIKSYDEHPLVKFYNKGLTNSWRKEEQCAQLNVSINTDDQGVFSTCLCNEYALMVSALGQIKDNDGKHLYQKADIYEWIQNIQEMGNNQSFYNCDKQSVWGEEDENAIWD